MSNNSLSNYTINNKVFDKVLNQGGTGNFTYNLAKNYTSFSPSPNSSLNGPLGGDTVQISSKTPEKSGVLENIKGFFKPKSDGKFSSMQKAVFIGVPALVAAGVGVFAFVKKGKAPSAATFVENVSDQKLDRAAKGMLKNVNLKNGFEDAIQNENDLKRALRKIFPRADVLEINKIAERYSSDNNTAEAVRILTGSNMRAKVQIEDLSGFFREIDDPKKINIIDMNDFVEFMKFKTLDKDVVPTINLGVQYRNYASNPDEAKRFITSVLKFSNSKKQLMNPFAILKKYNFDSKAGREFLCALKQETVGVKSYSLQCMMEDDLFDPVAANKFIRSLDKNALKHTGFESIRGILTSADIDPVSAAEKLNSLPADILSKFTNEMDALTCIRFERFAGKKSTNELSMAEKKELLRRLIKNNTNSFGNGVNNELFPLLPKNKDEYCTLVKKLSSSIGIVAKPLTSAQKTAFDTGIAAVASNIRKLNLDDVDISLSSKSREAFISEVSKAMESLKPAEKRKIMDYFGFELADIAVKEGSKTRKATVLRGYPVSIDNKEKFGEITSKATRKALDKVKAIVEEFSNGNKIVLTPKNGAALTPEMRQFEDDLNNILEGLPELRTIIGKSQHKTHSYTIDGHTLRVLQGVASDPKFAALSDGDKKVLTIASLLHDVTKTEGIVDKVHPFESAFDAFYMTEKLGLKENDRLKIYELISSHEWLGRMNKGKKSPADIQRIAQDVAFETRHSNTFDLAEILCKADIMAVQKNGAYFTPDKAKALEDRAKDVRRWLDRIHMSEIFLPQTQFPSAGDALKAGGAVKKTANGVTNSVIYMNRIADGEDLTKYGFAPGTTKKNWRVLVHALADKDNLSTVDTFSLVDADALLSTSYIDAFDYRTYRKQGLILDVARGDIQAGYKQDFGSGYGKSIELLKADYLFRGERKCPIKGWYRRDRTEYRDYISSCIKEAMGTRISRDKTIPMSDEAYVELLEKIKDCKSITDIEKIDKEFAKKLLKIFDSMESGKRYGGRQYNEILVTRPKIQGVYAYGQSYESVPLFLRKYAEEHNLPVIIFGK